MGIPKEYGGHAFLGDHAFARGRAHFDALGRRRGDGDGAELARPRRTAAALRHRGAEEILPAAPGQGRRDSVLRPDRPGSRLRRGRDAIDRHRRETHRRRQGSARPAPELEEALHHAGAGRDADRPGVPHQGSGPPARRQGGPRHFLRADSARSRRRRDRPAPRSDGRAVHERTDRRQRRVRADGLHHRRQRRHRPRLAHADGMPRRRPLDLAAGA